MVSHLLPKMVVTLVKLPRIVKIRVRLCSVIFRPVIPATNTISVWVMRRFPLTSHMVIHLVAVRLTLARIAVADKKR
jgi:hypothetical protein